MGWTPVRLSSRRVSLVMAWVQQPTRAIQPMKTIPLRTPRCRQSDAAISGRSVDDHTAAHIDVTELSRRARLADHPGVAAERVVQTVRRVPAAPQSEHEDDALRIRRATKPRILAPGRRPLRSACASSGSGRASRGSPVGTTGACIGAFVLVVSSMLPARRRVTSVGRTGASTDGRAITSPYLLRLHKAAV